MPQPDGAPSGWVTPVALLVRVATASVLVVVAVTVLRVGGFECREGEQIVRASGQARERHGRLRLEGVARARVAVRGTIVVRRARAVRDLAEPGQGTRHDERPAVGERPEVGIELAARAAGALGVGRARRVGVGAADARGWRTCRPDAIAAFAQRSPSRGPAWQKPARRAMRRMVYRASTEPKSETVPAGVRRVRLRHEDGRQRLPLRRERAEEDLVRAS
jgi:hypothetical protein